jgi:hypothetical protein
MGTPYLHMCQRQQQKQQKCGWMAKDEGCLYKFGPGASLLQVSKIATAQNDNSSSSSSSRARLILIITHGP